MSAVRILGIDPGLASTGYGVIDRERSQLAYVASGRVRSKESDPLAGRLAAILAGLAEVIERYHPEQCAIEKVFVNVNPQSTLLLGQARGAAMCAAVLAQLAVSEYTALQVKQSVVGHGQASKEQVQEMVKRLLRLPAAPGPDASDALACAICHAHGGMGLGALPTQGRRVRAGRIV